MARSNSDHNGWTWVFGKNKQHQTKPIDNPYVKDVEKIATSFFVTNFSNSLDAKNLWKEFQPFGRIVDAFIANKRSKQGKCFGFVRFLGIHNEEVFAKLLSNVWIGSYHVFVLVARFQRNPIKPHALTQKLPKASHDRPTFNTNNLPPKRSYASVTHAESRNNLSQQSKMDNIKSIQLNDDDLILVEDSSTVVLIKVKEIETISNMYYVCQAEGFVDVKIHYVGGLWVWLQFSLVNSCEAFKSNESLNKLWTFIKVPSHSFVVDERVIWIEVIGLPLCAWGSSAFKKIANLFGTWSTLIPNDMDSNEFDDDHDMKEHRSTNEDVDPNAALDDFIKHNIVKESALKDSKEGDQANVSTHVAGDNETLFSEKVKEEYFVTKEDKPSEEDVSNTSKPPGFEKFIKENSECSISSNASRSGKCSTSFGNYKRKELKGFSFIDEISRMIEVGGTLGYHVKGCKKSLRKTINEIGVSMADKGIFFLSISGVLRNIGNVFG
nr:RNA-directed DNA polymerase, eukaryota, reverse transcriptase zinc-binding domain protein [Tanacetum cinerariifolium]